MRSDSSRLASVSRAWLVLADGRREREVRAGDLAGQAQAERVAVQLRRQQPVARRLRGMRVTAPQVDLRRRRRRGRRTRCASHRASGRLAVHEPAALAAAAPASMPSLRPQVGTGDARQRARLGHARRRDRGVRVVAPAPRAPARRASGRRRSSTTDRAGRRVGAVDRRQRRRQRQVGLALGLARHRAAGRPGTRPAPSAPGAAPVLALTPHRCPPPAARGTCPRRARRSAGRTAARTAWR